jgi:hypothetical protein
MKNMEKIMGFYNWVKVCIEFVEFNLETFRSYFTRTPTRTHLKITIVSLKGHSFETNTFKKTDSVIILTLVRNVCLKQESPIS